MRWIRAMVAAAAVMASSAVLAQDAHEEVKPIDLDFKGGTAAEFVEAVRKASPETNVAVMTDLAQVALPPVKLRKVDPGTALDLLAIVPRHQGEQLITLQVGRFSDPHGEVFTISGEIVKGRPSAPDVAVHSIREVVSDEVDQAGVLTAIEAAVELADSNAAPAVLRFHDATGLLILRGSERQLASAAALIAQLQEQKQYWLNQKARTSTSQQQELQRRLEEAIKALEQESRRANEAQRTAKQLDEELLKLREAQRNLQAEHQTWAQIMAAKDQELERLSKEMEALRKDKQPR